MTSQWSAVVQHKICARIPEKNKEDFSRQNTTCNFKFIHLTNFPDFNIGIEKISGWLGTFPVKF